MDVPHDAILLRIFTSTADRFGLHPLYHAIVLRAREMHLSGATVFRGSLGFGQSSKLHHGQVFQLSQDLPVVVEIVDSEEKISAFLRARRNDGEWARDARSDKSAPIQSAASRNAGTDQGTFPATSPCPIIMVAKGLRCDHHPPPRVKTCTGMGSSFDGVEVPVTTLRLKAVCQGVRRDGSSIWMVGRRAPSPIAAGSYGSR
jgi:PII-like signaling protein